MGRLVFADVTLRFRNGLLLYHHLSYIILKIIRNFSCRKSILTKRRKYPLISTIGDFCQECAHGMTRTAVTACPSAT